MKFSTIQPGDSRIAGIARRAAPALLALLIAGCAGPPVLERQVLGYDDVTSRLDQKLLLVNIARADNGKPVHFTTTSTIAATFNWTSTLGAGAEWHRNTPDNFLGLNIGTGVSENPTFSIHPLSGKAFTERVLTPFKDKSFEFLVFQGGAIDRVMRLLASGIEVQKADGSFVRFIANDPALPQEYTEFRRIATHLRWLNDSRKLFVRALVFEEPLAPDLKAQPSAADIINADKEGLQWRRNADGSFRLVRLQAGRVVVMNVDPMSLDNQARYELNERIKRNPGGFVFLDVRPDGPGGNFPIRGAIKLRSMLQMLAFVASGARAVPEFDVAPDPRTGAVSENPRSALHIDISEVPPATTIASVEFEGRAYSVGNTTWDRANFATLGDLFQTAVGDIKGVDLPITISK
ncbi:conserved hypothetical protein [Candidatus Propionivibrio aalborgensis]|uniref:Lipoprotein n=1 Tax=Candidatus Propionivibrio aalborgensis TaxID=1860101 RepID=A0A1A8Y0N3_9RHOO|nr:hypothetical protein [Candidatus Propionivibrio aalborgensis]SBT10557.1 conserved hypothetical protein [Candidatus Propionivibrio aalborgensis]